MQGIAPKTQTHHSIARKGGIVKDKRNFGRHDKKRSQSSLSWTGLIIQTRIEKLVPGGQGLARHEGQVVFVEGVLPGELVEIELSEAKGGYRRARLKSLLEPSVHRVKPACLLFGQCGGCDLQQTDYPAQLDIKRGILVDTLRRQGGFGIDGLLPDILVEPGEPWGYRNRMRFHALPANPQGDSSLGLMRRASDQIVAVTDCPVAVDEIRQWLKKTSRTDQPLILGKDDSVSVFGAQGRVVVAQGDISVELSGKKLLFSVEGFFQSNVAMLQTLLTRIARWIETIGPIPAALDLYCGSAVFAALLPDSCQRIVAVDNSPLNCHYARLNTDSRRTTIFEGDVDAWLATNDSAFPDLVIVDPPRTGLSRGLVDSLIRESPGNIFFISCDPVTFSRDLKILREAGYQVRELVLFDFYPQTSHIETACWLEKPGS